eukprot:COSAG06_NODE_24333_length_663_cov_0.550265_2_plen_33_part_01
MPCTAQQASTDQLPAACSRPVSKRAKKFNLSRA